MYNLARLLQDVGRLKEALPLFELAICYKRLGPEHPDTKYSEENLEELSLQPEAAI